MALNFVYPTAAVMKEIFPDLIMRDRADRLGLQLFPVVQEATFFLRWAQKDNAHGVMQMRGLDGQPPKVTRQGLNTFVQEPGVYGEHIVITERELLTRADPLDLTKRIPIGTMVAECNDLLKTRLNDRMELNVWNMLATGRNSIPIAGPNGVTIYTDQYTLQTYTAAIPWSSASTATPLANLQAIQQLSVGHGASFQTGAKLYMNQVTANRLLNNANAADYGGRRNAAGATLNNLGAFNNYFAGQNLPEIVIYDAGYQPFPVSGPITNPLSQFIKFIPDGVGILVGRRPGNSPVGEWRQTIQAMQPGGESPGEYNYIKDYARGINAPIETPPKIEVHAGFNGGIVIYYPSAIVTCTF